METACCLTERHYTKNKVTIVNKVQPYCLTKFHRQCGTCNRQRNSLLQSCEQRTFTQKCHARFINKRSRNHLYSHSGVAVIKGHDVMSHTPSSDAIKKFKSQTRQRKFSYTQVCSDTPDGITKSWGSIGFDRRLWISSYTKDDPSDSKDALCSASCARDNPRQLISGCK
jgi:hypothetical protein